MAGCCHDRRLIGEILLERGVIRGSQLKEALAAQKAEGGRVFLGEILVRLGHVTEIDVVTALVLQCNLPYIAVTRHVIDPDVARLIPADIARRERLVPLERIGNILSVVMQNPLDDETRHEVEVLTRCRIATFISTRSEIDQAIAAVYPSAMEKI